MTFSRRTAIKMAGLTLSFMLLSAASLRGLSGARESLQAAHDEHQQLRLLREISLYTETAGSLIQPRGGSAQSACGAIDRAIEGLDRLTACRRAATKCSPAWRGELEAVAQSRAQLVGIRQAISPGSAARLEPAGSDLLIPIDQALGSVARLADQMDRSIEQAHMESASRLRNSLILVSVCAGGGLLIILLLMVSQYRGVLVPLGQLRTGLQRMINGHFKEPIRLDAAPEFTALATDLNQIAVQLDTLRSDLEHKIAMRSRELARSERLASVGFLAAGVAHEINNPLNIITGYAELFLRQADSLPASRAVHDVKEAFQIIREEGFRCKSITDKLVALAKARGGNREAVSVARLARSVVALVQSLDQTQDSSIRLELPPSDLLTVWGNENELRQVVLSLLANAMQALPPETGQIIVRGTRLTDGIELSIMDNGCGMTPEVLEHVFEPFYCKRWRNGERGMGLGLSITHAIVEAHGGKMTAESAGPGQGRKFTMRFPDFNETQTTGEKAA